MSKRLFPAIALTLAFGVTPALAHHSFSMFDATRDVTVAGTVKSYAWTNPHVWVDLEVAKPGGGTEIWGLESRSLGILSRLGWKGTSLKPGDKVRVQLHPMKDGKPGGQVMKIMLADGSQLSAQNTARPAY